MTNNKATNFKGSKTALADLQQFFQTSKSDSWRPDCHMAEGLIHEDNAMFLDVYYSSHYGPWRMEGKRFICGPTRQDIRGEVKKYTSWFGGA